MDSRTSYYRKTGMYTERKIKYKRRDTRIYILVSESMVDVCGHKTAATARQYWTCWTLEVLAGCQAVSFIVALLNEMK